MYNHFYNFEIERAFLSTLQKYRSYNRWTDFLLYKHFKFICVGKKPINKIKGETRNIGENICSVCNTEKLVSLLHRAFFQNYMKNLMTAWTKYVNC